MSFKRWLSPYCYIGFFVFFIPFSARAQVLPVESPSPAYNHMASDPPDQPDSQADSQSVLAPKDDEVTPEPAEPPAAPSAEAEQENTAPALEPETTPAPQIDNKPQAVEAPQSPEAATKPAPSAPPRNGTDEAESRLTPEQRAALANPTRSVEAYEKAREALLNEKSIPDWSFDINVAPFAFRNADLRVPISAAPNEGKPKLIGVIVGGERMLIRHAGLGSVGLRVGDYGTTTHNLYSGLMTAIISAGPYVMYQADFMNRQIVVPIAKAGIDFDRVSYTFANNNVHDFRALPRLDLGVLVYLNFLEPSSAGEIQSDFGIKRTYLSAYYTIAHDPSKKDLDLSEDTLRVGFRFEL